MKPPWSTEQIRSECTGTDGIQLVAECEGKVCGYLFMMDGVGETELLRIGVSFASRNRGVGFRLLQAGLSIAKERGFERCYLEVRQSNQAALRAYERAGFYKVGERPRYYQKPVEDAVIMQKELFMPRGGYHEDAQ